MGSIIFFQAEADAISALEAKISEQQSELAEAVETAQEESNYEPEDSEDAESKVTATVIKGYLKSLIDDLAESSGESAQKEQAKYETLRDGIVEIENRIKAAKAEAQELENELALKIQIKRIGAAEVNTETQELIESANDQLAALDAEMAQTFAPLLGLIGDYTNFDEAKKRLGDAEKKLKKSDDPSDKAQLSTIREMQKIIKPVTSNYNALKKDKATLETRQARIDAVSQAIGGQLTEEEAKQLILTKLYDLAHSELNRYLKAERRTMVNAIENLWDKYAVSIRYLEANRRFTLEQLNKYLNELGYFR